MENPFAINVNQYKELIRQRHIKYLVHFTKSSVLPFIFGRSNSVDGILSSQKVADNLGPNHIYDKKRLDNHSNYVCCSIQRINKFYYNVRKKAEKRRGDIFNQWAVVFINPDVINDSTLFCPTNAASKVPLSSGINAFKSLFGPEVPNKHGKDGYWYRNDYLPACYPTDCQAEVLIKDRIPKSELLGVAFPPKSAKVEEKRLNFWDQNHIHIYNWSDCTYGF